MQTGVANGNCNAHVRSGSSANTWPSLLMPARRRATRLRTRQADDEDAAAAEQISNPTTKKQESSEGEDVGIYDPGQVHQRKVQAPSDGREGNVDDGGVQDDHEL